MSLLVQFPAGHDKKKTVDLTDTAVIRAVDAAESQRANDRTLEFLQKQPSFNGVVPDTRWTIAVEVPGKSPIYTTGDLSALIANTALSQHFDLVDGGRAAISRKAKVHLIRPLIAREGSDRQAIIWVEGGSSNGLYVSSDMATIKAELGPKASRLVAVGDEGFIDRSRITAVRAFDPSKDLAPNQQRYAIAVQFQGVNAARPQFFRATESELRGATILDLTATGPRRPARVATGNGDAKPAPRG